jgi:D-3-phosphoglycerate dehydrogenase / 2-oxoglutarate reductase
VNTSRGEVIDEGALVHALRDGRLAGAALDVMHNERDPEERNRSPLLAYARWHDNLLLTPHIGGATRESMKRTEIFMAYKLAGFLKNEAARTQMV